MEHGFTVKQVAKKLNLSEHTIRFYCDKGLIPAVQRDRNNNRIFTQESINWLTGVKYLRDSGMSLESIKKYVDLCLIGDETILERYSIIQEQRELAKIQLQEAKERLEYLEYKLSHYKDIIEHRIDDDMNPGKW